jgi:hypothetical protein
MSYAIAYLLCRAVETGGDPGDEVVDAVVGLYPHDPARVQAMRGPPLEPFLDEVDARFIARQRRQSSY